MFYQTLLSLFLLTDQTIIIISLIVNPFHSQFSFSIFFSKNIYLFQETSYLKIGTNPRKKDQDYFQLGFDFRTFEENGLILYSALPKSGHIKAHYILGQYALSTSCLFCWTGLWAIWAEQHWLCTRFLPKLDSPFHLISGLVIKHQMSAEVFFVVSFWKEKRTVWSRFYRRFWRISSI